MIWLQWNIIVFQLPVRKYIEISFLEILHMCNTQATATPCENNRSCSSFAIWRPNISQHFVSTNHNQEQWSKAHILCSNHWWVYKNIKIWSNQWHCPWGWLADWRLWTWQKDECNNSLCAPDLRWWVEHHFYVHVTFINSIILCALSFFTFIFCLLFIFHLASLLDNTN